MKILLLAISLMLLSPDSFAHTRVKANSTLVPRSSSDSIKSGPCGGLPRSASPVVLEPGQTITVQWEETINHPGRFEFYFSQAGDANWTMMKTIADDKNGTNDLPHQFSTTLTMPAVTCTDCTIQLIQVMTENATNPSYYYSCSDIKLQNAAPALPPPMVHGPSQPCN